MSHLIRYKFSQGDVLTYDHEVTLLLEEPDGTKHNGVIIEESIQTVSIDHGGWWDIMLTVSRVSSSGPLAGELPEQLKNRSTSMQMDSRGSLLDAGTGGQAPRVPAFPIEEVSPGESWVAVAPAPDGGEPLEIEWYFYRLETKNGEEIAHLVTLANSTHSDGYSSRTEGTVVFSLTHGHQISSTTVVKLTWTNGQFSHSVTNLKLRQRSSG